MKLAHLLFVNAMKAPHLLFLLLFSTVLTHSQQQQCVQSEFSGEAVQGQQFNQELGEGLVLSVVPMRNAQWGWFQIRVRDESHGPFVFNQSDMNWLLATPDWGSAFIGGPNSDQKAALEYRLRYLAIPMSLDNKEALRKTTSFLSTAKTPEEEQSAVAALKSMRLGQITFQITEYRFADGQPPTSVNWVKFTGIVTVPTDFLLSGKLISAKRSLRYVECPDIPDEVIENIRNPKSHEYFLPKVAAGPPEP